MRVALVAFGDQAPGSGLVRHVDRLAEGLVSRGAEVEIVSLGDAPRPNIWANGIGKRIPRDIRRLRFVVPSAFWRVLELTEAGFDLVDIHISQPPMAPPGTPLAHGPIVLTLHAPVERLRRWPYARAMGALVDISNRVLCASRAERDLLFKAFPQVARRAEVLGPGVDESAIRTAAPFVSQHTIMLAVGRLERRRRVDRAIAAMPSLDPHFRLVVLGDGPDRRRLVGYAADLQVDRRVTLAGAVPDAVHHRWLRTARVFLALASEANSGVHVMEALAAGASVVASDIPVHREAVEQLGRGMAFFVSPDGSPLDVADAVELGGRQPVPMRPVSVPSWESVLDTTWEIYRQVAYDAARIRYVDYRHSAAS